MLNWYRAAFRNAGRLNEVDPTIRVPLHIIWGEKGTHIHVRIVQQRRRIT
jgi:hypothetical protein